MLIFLTGREQASRYDMFLPEYTLPSQYREACLTAMRGAAWLGVDRRWADPNFLKSMFPAMQNSHPPETEKFEDAMQKGFELVGDEGGIEIRRRTAGTSATVCDGIDE